MTRFVAMLDRSGRVVVVIRVIFVTASITKLVIKNGVKSIAL